MPNVVGVRFHPASKIYFFDSHRFSLKIYERVVVGVEGGQAIATVVIDPREVDSWPDDLRKVIRKAEEADIAAQAEFEVKAKEAAALCKDKIRELNLDMKLVDVEYILSGNKAFFYFTSEGRVDFRQLVKDLAGALKIRVEMRQIGIRDESKMIGGIAVCGRRLCCSSWLDKFGQLSIKMAKEQNMSLSPEKVSGLCGRLLCCLAHEDGLYKEILDKLPKVGKRAKTPHGECKVNDVNIFKNYISFYHPDEGPLSYDITAYKRWLAGEEISKEDVIYKPVEVVAPHQQAKDAVANLEKELEIRRGERRNDDREGSEEKSDRGRRQNRGDRRSERDRQPERAEGGEKSDRGANGDRRPDNRERRERDNRDRPPRDNRDRPTRENREGGDKRDNREGRGGTENRDRRDNREGAERRDNRDNRGGGDPNKRHPQGQGAPGDRNRDQRPQQRRPEREGEQRADSMQPPPQTENDGGENGTEGEGLGRQGGQNQRNNRRDFDNRRRGSNNDRRGNRRHHGHNKGGAGQRGGDSNQPTDRGDPNEGSRNDN